MTSVVVLTASAGVWCALVPAAAKPERDLAALETKLLGAWVGQGPCDGRLTLRADGTYKRALHGPAGNNSAGEWAVRWNALPPTLVQVAEHDVLAGEDVELARLVGEAGGTVRTTLYPGMIHGFWRHSQAFDAAEEALAEAAQFLRATLEG